MAKLKITKEDKEEFKKTTNGAKKGIWMIVGMLIDFLATLGISFLNIFSGKLPNVMYYYIILFILLIIVVLGGEMIGVYYGALEQYVYQKNNKKVIDLDE
jgi:formate hydrogenlyase subunit 3/multisubunit Na+/H+ antiporter MnhD subunit